MITFCYQILQLLRGLSILISYLLLPTGLLQLLLRQSEYFLLKVFDLLEKLVKILFHFFHLLYFFLVYLALAVHLGD